MAGSEIGQFEQICINTLSPDNNIRGAAEAQFEACKNDPTKFFMYLMQLLLESKNPVARKFAAVMLRQNLTTRSGGLWQNSAPQAQVFVKNSLLSMLEGEQDRQIRKSAVDCISRLAASLLDNENNQWPELLPALMKAAQTQHALHQESALTLVSRLSEHAELIIKNGLAQLSPIIQNGLSNEDRHVRRAAVDAIASLVIALNENDRQGFVPAIPAMFQCVAQAAEQHDDSGICELLQTLLPIASEEPTFLRTQVNSIAELLCGIAKEARMMEMSTRRMAMEFLLTLATTGKGMIRKNAAFVNNVVPLAFVFLLELDEEGDWESANDEDDMEQEAFLMGMEAIDRLAVALGGKKFGSVALPLVQQFVNNQDWKHRHAALVAVSEMADGCKRELVGDTLRQFTQLICEKVTNDPNPRVRWAGLSVLSNFATDLKPKFQKTFHREVVPVLLQSMACGHRRLARVAAFAIVDFCAGIADEEDNDDFHALMAPYVSPAMEASLNLLNSNDVKCQEAAFTVVSSLAAVSPDTFKGFYDQFMPSVLNCLQQTAGQENLRELRGKAMECVGNLAKAVGKEKFRPQANQVMQMLVQTLANGLANDDPQYHYLVQACARICQCLKEEFVPYLDHVIPPLLEAAGQDGCVIVEEASQPDRFKDDYNYVSSTHDLRGQGPMRVSINTSALEEKAAACNMLFQYAFELSDLFGSWIEPTFNVLLPMVHYKFNDTVRVAAIQAMPFLLQAVRMGLKKQNLPRNAVMQMFEKLFDPMFQAVAMEFDLTNMTGVLEAFAECIGELEQPLPEEPMAKISHLISGLVQESEGRRQDYLKAMQQPDFDEEEMVHIEEQIEIEDEFLSTAHSIINALAKVSKESFHPIFEKYLQNLFWPMLDPKAAKGQTIAALCVFDDVIGKCGAPASKYVEQFLPLVLQYCAHENEDLRQCAVFGVGCCAENLKAAFAPAIQQCVETLMAVINAPNSREDDNEPVTDNAISSLGKVAEHCLQGHPEKQAQLFSIWLGQLPLNGDWEEAKLVHKQMMDLVKQNNPAVMGANNSNLPQIISIMCKTVGDENITDEDTRADMVGALKQFAAAQPQALEAVMAQLPEEQRKTALQCVNA